MATHLDTRGFLKLTRVSLPEVTEGTVTEYDGGLLQSCGSLQTAATPVGTVTAKSISNIWKDPFSFPVKQCSPFSTGSPPHVWLSSTGSNNDSKMESLYATSFESGTGHGPHGLAGRRTNFWGGFILFGFMCTSAFACMYYVCAW